MVIFSSTRLQDSGMQYCYLNRTLLYSHNNHGLLWLHNIISMINLKINQLIIIYKCIQKSNNYKNCDSGYN